MNILTLTFTADEYSVTASFATEKLREHSVAFKPLNERGEPAGSVWYTFPSEADFAAWWNAAEAKMYERRLAAQAEKVRAQRHLGAFYADLEPRVRDALYGLKCEPQIIAALRAAIEYNNVLDDITVAIAGMGKKELRAALRAALSAGREEAREQYPDDYRDADDKEEFYATFADDVGTAFVQHLIG